MSGPTETTESDALFEIARRLARARSYDQVVDVVRSAARGIVGALGITFVRCEGDECAYIAEDAIEPFVAGTEIQTCPMRFGMGNGERGSRRHPGYLC
jgi:hypothetical protein